MENLDLSKNNLRKFGITMAIAILVFAGLVFWLKHKIILRPALYCSLTFLSLAIILPVVLKPVYIVWMKFAHILGWINTRLIVFIIFYLIFAPMGIIMRLLGKDLLERKMGIKMPTYWHKKEAVPFNRQDYERKF